MGSEKKIKFNRQDLATYSESYLRKLINQHNVQIERSKRRKEIYEEELEKRGLDVPF
jgi:hypothetical protein